MKTIDPDETRTPTHEMLVRPMRSDDLRAVCALWNHHGVSPTDPADEFSALSLFLARNPKTTMVVEDGDRIVGVVLCGEDGRAGFIHRVSLEPRYRTEAVVSLALRRAMLRLRALGLTRCILLERQGCHVAEIGRASVLGFGHAVVVLTDCVLNMFQRSSHEDAARGRAGEISSARSQN